MTTGKIFISYRRADTAGYARSIFDRLNARFPDRVLIDLAIPPGVNFVTWIEEQVSSCCVFLEIIGNEWATIADSGGRRRLDDPGDQVRGEIASALHRTATGRESLTIIPILVEGAAMPASSILPEDIAAFSLHNALIVTELDFDHDISRLIARLSELLGPDSHVEKPPVNRRKKALAIGSTLLGLVLVGLMAMLLNSYISKSDPKDGGNSRIIVPSPINPAPSPNRPDKIATPSGTILFANSISNLSGKLVDAYVDFSFYYPSAWRKDPAAGIPGARNFVRVERRLPWDMTQESFAVGHYEYDHEHPEKRAAQIAELNSAVAGQIPEYRKVSEGWTEIGTYRGYEFRFEGIARHTEQGDVHIWGRTILLPPPDEGKNGVTLLLMATSLAPELKSLNDVGVRGEAPIILQTFKFGPQ